VKIAQPGCAFRSSWAGGDPDTLVPELHHHTEGTMLDLIFTIGQAGCAMLILYGACLVLMPARKAAAQSSALKDQIALHETMLYDV
jgi:hypothetical protein